MDRAHVVDLLVQGGEVVFARLQNARAEVRVLGRRRTDPERAFLVMRDGRAPPIAVSTEQLLLHLLHVDDRAG
jgi:hypothetical protein